MPATFARWKGQPVFLRAAGLLARRRPDLAGAERVRFVIIGGAVYHTAGSQFTEPELRALAAAEGIADRVEFAGFVSDMPAALAGLDVVVHASTDPEPFGRTVAEGMAAGKPVIISRAGGAAELFTEGVDGLGVAPGDAEGLSRAMERLLGDAELRSRLGTAARATARARFSRERMGRELAAVFGDRLK